MLLQVQQLFEAAALVDGAAAVLQAGVPSYKAADWTSVSVPSWMDESENLNNVYAYSHQIAPFVLSVWPILVTVLKEPAASG